MSREVKIGDRIIVLESNGPCYAATVLEIGICRKAMRVESEAVQFWLPMTAFLDWIE